jgi:hypothetical protein
LGVLFQQHQKIHVNGHVKSLEGKIIQEWKCEFVFFHFKKKGGGKVFNTMRFDIYVGLEYSIEPKYLLWFFPNALSINLFETFQASHLEKKVAN